MCVCLWQWGHFLFFRGICWALFDRGFEPSNIQTFHQKARFDGWVVQVDNMNFPVRIDPDISGTVPLLRRKSQSTFWCEGHGGATNDVGGDTCQSFWQKKEKSKKNRYFSRCYGNFWGPTALSLEECNPHTSLHGAPAEIYLSWKKTPTKDV